MAWLSYCLLVLIFVLKTNGDDACIENNFFTESEILKNIIRKWWWSYVDVIKGDISIQDFNDNLVHLWLNDGILEEPGIFKYNGVMEMVNGRDINSDPIDSVVNGLLAFDINKLVLGDMFVEYITDNVARIRAFKTLLHHDKTLINYNYDTWIFKKDNQPKQEWKIQRLTIELDTYQHMCQT